MVETGHSHLRSQIAILISSLQNWWPPKHWSSSPNQWTVTTCKLRAQKCVTTHHTRAAAVVSPGTSRQSILDVANSTEMRRCQWLFVNSLQMQGPNCQCNGIFNHMLIWYKCINVLRNYAENQWQSSVVNGLFLICVWPCIMNVGKII